MIPCLLCHMLFSGGVVLAHEAAGGGDTEPTTTRPLNLLKREHHPAELLIMRWTTPEEGESPTDSPSSGVVLDQDHAAQQQEAEANAPARQEAVRTGGDSSISLLQRNRNKVVKKSGLLHAKAEHLEEHKSAKTTEQRDAREQGRATNLLQKKSGAGANVDTAGGRRFGQYLHYKRSRAERRAGLK